MWLSWQISLWVAAALGIGWAVTRRVDGVWQRQIAPLCKESALVFVIYATWRRLGEVTLLDTRGALGRARWIWHAERWVHLPNEVTLQHWALHAIWLIRAMNVYYIVFHVAPVGIFLIWLFVRHRDKFPYWRNQFAFVSIVCQCIQFIPVAPPRFFPQYGFIDTAAKYGPQVYDNGGTNIAGQLAAMPSMHVAWAMIIGIATMTVTRSKWRWLGAAHATLTVMAVTLTGYHWLLDGIVATSVLLLGMAVAALWNRSRGVPATQPVADLFGEPAEVN